MTKVKIKVVYGTEWQDKTFKSEDSAIEWCRRNYDKIGCINDTPTNYAMTSHFDIARAIRESEI